MTVIDVRKSPEHITMTMTAEFDAPIGRVWEMWSNPRKLERWGGPPTYPATVDEHNPSSGGRLSYSMPGPERDQSQGWWKVRAVKPPHHLDFPNASDIEQG